MRRKAVAREIMSRMKTILSDYGIVTVADLKTLVDIPPVFQDTKVGWRNLRGVKIKNTPKGLLFKFPKPTSIYRCY